jgi:hypothetical protein
MKTRKFFLRWMCKNNPDWIARGIKINLNNLNALPTHGIPLGIRVVKTTDF